MLKDCCPSIADITSEDGGFRMAGLPVEVADWGTEMGRKSFV